MKIIRSVDKNGATTERIELSGGEKAAIERAHKSVAERCAESGVGYGPEQKEWMDWCFLGAIRLGGIAELERYVQGLKIGQRKKTILAGYAEPVEIEE